MATDGRAEFTPSRIQQVQDHLQMKLVWLCREKGVEKGVGQCVQQRLWVCITSSSLLYEGMHLAIERLFLDWR
eukprot:3543081-Amphidinium_carterae.1